MAVKQKEPYFSSVSMGRHISGGYIAFTGEMCLEAILSSLTVSLQSPGGVLPFGAFNKSAERGSAK